MSPSEDDLRAALHRGEGGAPDVDRIVAAGAARRAQRRNLVTAVAAGVLIVGGVATGIAAVNGGSGSADQKSAAAGAPAADRNPDARAAQPSATASASSRRPAAAGTGQASSSDRCPTRFPAPSGSPSDPTSAVLPGELRSVLVCAYGSDLDIARGATPAATTLTGADARTLASSLESARKSPAGRTCLPTRTQNLVLIATDGPGRILPTVTVTYADSGCDGRVTNGAALRYGWTPPAAVSGELDGLSPSASASLPVHSPSGKNYGSPVR